MENENATERHFYRVKSQKDEADKMKLTEQLEQVKDERNKERYLNVEIQADHAVEKLIQNAYLSL